MTVDFHLQSAIHDIFFEFAQFYKLIWTLMENGVNSLQIYSSLKEFFKSDKDIP